MSTAFGNVERIASLLASGTEILYALGLGDRVCAVSHECDYPPDVARKPRVTFTRVAAEAASRQIDQQVHAMLAAGTALYEIDAGALAALAPDLIVTQAQCDVCAVKYEDVLAIVRDQPALRHTRIVALNPVTLADIHADIERVGSATGRQAQAAQYVAQLKARVEAVRSRCAPAPGERRPRVACLEWIDPPMLAGNWLPDLVELAGGIQPLPAGKPSPYTPWPEIVAFDPEVVVIMPCGFNLVRTIREAATLTGFADWSQLSAVRHGRVYAVDGNAYFNRSGPRIVDSLEILAQLIRADRFDGFEAGLGYKGVWSRWA